MSEAGARIHESAVRAPLMQVRDVAKSFPDRDAGKNSRRTIFSSVTFDLPKGEITALLGPNGVGKTTLMRILMGLETADSGEVATPGLAGTAKSANQSRWLLGGRRSLAAHIGYVPQLHAVGWHMPVTAKEFVATGLDVRPSFRNLGSKDSSSQAAVMRALAQVQLADRAQSVIGTLSGGQRQRLLLARALVHAPQLIILDEPFTGVDQPTQDLLSEQLRALADSGVTVLVATHDIVHALSWCDNVLLLNKVMHYAGPIADAGDFTVWQHTFGLSPQSPVLATWLHTIAAHGEAVQDPAAQEMNSEV